MIALNKFTRSIAILSSISSILLPQFFVQAQKSVVQANSVCGLTPPPGYVVTRFEHSTGCIPSWDRSISIRPNKSILAVPKKGMSVCKGSIPKGFVVTQSIYLSGCDIYPNDSHYPNAAIVN
jgi:hypothetical protein